jgi:hypothetical protein
LHGACCLKQEEGEMGAPKAEADQAGMNSAGQSSRA